jgi:hypothetical protein
MQFLPATFGAYARPVPAAGADPPSPYDPVDAIYAAARMLCADDAVRDINAAVFAYNHSTDYLGQVLDWATRYSQTDANSALACGSFQPAVQPSGRDLRSPALAAVQFACAQIGKPYVWGGNGEVGFDCSGLTHAAYAAAGITIPRTAQSQYEAGPLLPAGTPLLPGDLVFFGTPGRIHHVGISLGGTLIINAPNLGQNVRVEDVRDFPDPAGASRPDPG